MLLFRNELRLWITTFIHFKLNLVLNQDKQKLKKQQHTSLKKNIQQLTFLETVALNTGIHASKSIMHQCHRRPTCHVCITLPLDFQNKIEFFSRLFLNQGVFLSHFERPCLLTRALLFHGAVSSRLGLNLVSVHHRQIHVEVTSAPGVPWPTPSACMSQLIVAAGSHSSPGVCADCQDTRRTRRVSSSYAKLVQILIWFSVGLESNKWVLSL